MLQKSGKSLWYGSPCYKRLVTGWFVDCLRLYPQSCVKVRSDPAAARWGFPASVPPGPCDRWHHGGYCCWGTCSSPVRQRGCSLPPAGGEAACWTRLGRTKAAAWRRGALRPPRSGSPKWHLSKTNGSMTTKTWIYPFSDFHLSTIWNQILLFSMIFPPWINSHLIKGFKRPKISFSLLQSCRIFHYRVIYYNCDILSKNLCPKSLKTEDVRWKKNKWLNT